MGKVVNVMAKAIIKSDLAARKMLGIRKPKSPYFITKDGIVKRRWTLKCN